MSSAIVVGSGPNGLAAAAHLAREGVDVTVLEAADEIGGGTRSSEMIVPGLLHDHCSAFHPVAAASPFLRDLDLGRHGLRWLRAPIDCAHPLDDGTAGVLHTSIQQTADGLGADGDRWRQLGSLITKRFDDLFGDAAQPVLRLPSHPILLARFGVPAALPATALLKLWKHEPAKSLFAGIAAHACYRLDRPMSSAIGLMILAAGHEHGWVVAEGGSQSIANALAAEIEQHGGTIETGQKVSSFDDLPASDIVMLDLSPGTAADILGNRLPASVSRAYRKYRHGSGTFKVDFAVEQGVPWTASAATSAGTVHLGGDSAEVIASERAVHDGHMPPEPFVLVGQQYLADPERSVGDVHPIWSYAHVPHGYTGDATQAIIGQIERFAPGFRERVVGMAVRSTTETSTYNPNYVGGDVIGGAASAAQLVFRPRFARDPYSTGIAGTYLCSASTPPGAGAHGMCGYNAAERALTELRGG